MTRHRLSWCIQRKTIKSQKDLEKLIDKLIAYVPHARRLHVRLSYTDRDVIAMDETAVLWDMLSNTTVDSIGHNTKAMKTTGQEKTKVSVCLTAKADWAKWRPFIVFPGAKRETKLLNEEFKAKCVVASSSNGKMIEELTFDWVRSVLENSSFTWRILAWDSFKCHVMETIKSYARQRQIFNHPRGLYEIHWGTRRCLE